MKITLVVTYVGKLRDVFKPARWTISNLPSLLHDLEGLTPGTQLGQAVDIACPPLLWTAE
jgi:hypothetical protein